MAASVLYYICIKDGQSKIYKRVYDPVFNSSYISGQMDIINLIKISKTFCIMKTLT